MRKEKEYNDHHWCPRSRFWATNDLNIETLRKSLHDAIHTVFTNDIFPEQIERLTNMTSRVLLPEIQKELIERLHYRDVHDPSQRYKEDALRLPKRFKHNQQKDGENQIS